MRRTSILVRCRGTAALLLTVLAMNLRSQTWSAAVAEMRLLDLPEVVDRGTAIPTGSVDGTAVLFWNATRGRLLLATSDAARRAWQLRPFSVAAPFRDVRVHDLDNDGTSELLLIDPSARAIRIVTQWTAADTIRPSSVVHCPVTPSRVLIADLTSDRLPDLVVFDENEPGLQLIMNRGHRRWQVGRPMAADVPFRDAAVTYLNNDEIPDLIAYDWVRSEFHTLYGVGSGRFLDQGIFPSEATVDRLLMADPRPDEPVRFLTVEQARGVVTYWSMDDVGELAERARTNVGGVIRSSFVSSTDPRGVAEFSVLTAGGRIIRLEGVEASGDPLETVDAGVPERSTWAFPIRRPDRLPADVMVLSPDQLTAVLLVRAADASIAADSSWWSTGVRPEAAETADLNGDGRWDLLVGNRGSRRIDLLWSGRLSERPAGIEVGVDGASVGARRVDSAIVRFITTHPESRSVAIHDLDRRDASVTSMTLPVQGTPEWATETSNAPTELAVVHASSAASIGVSLFESIRPETFLEHNLSLSAPSTLLGALVGDADADGRPDLYMVYKPDDTSNVTVGVAYGDSVMSMRRRALLQEFSFSAAQRAWVWQAHLDGDSLNDLVIVFPRVLQAIYILPGRADTLLAEPVLVDSSVRIPSRGLFRLADLDGDSVLDLIAQVPQRGGVGWWKGDGKGGFDPWGLLVPVRDVGGLAVGDVTGDGHVDLILTRPTWGAVTIYDAASLVRLAPPSAEVP